MNREELVNEFINKVKTKFEGIYLGYYYNETDDIYRIWHTYNDYEDIEFRKVLGKYIKETLLENRFFNFSIIYDNRFEHVNIILPQKTKTLLENHTWVTKDDINRGQYTINGDVKINFLGIENTTTLTRAIPDWQIEGSNVFPKGDLAA